MRMIIMALATFASVPMAFASSGNVFNPEISLILQGRYQHLSDTHAGTIAGFLIPGDTHGSERGLTLDHSELTFRANVDPYITAFANLALQDDELEIEEAWFQTLALGRGMTLRGGRFLSQVGYINEVHPHAWEFADQNLAWQVLFGEHLIQDGLQARWIAPTDRFVEFGLEVARGQFFPGSEASGDRNGAGSRAAFVHIGDDLGFSHSWRVGLSYLDTSVRERESGAADSSGVETEVEFSGSSKTWIADIVWKWAPDGNVRERNLKMQAEFFRRQEQGELGCEDNQALGGACTGTRDDYRSRQSGFYAQAVYQFIPRWRIGYRYDRLDPGTVDYGINAAALSVPDHDPERHTIMIDYSPSEFSRLRLQLARDHSMPESTATVGVLQYIMSIGPHGAHKF